MNLLFIFLDGVGLGLNDPRINPFARTIMPVMESLLDHQHLLIDSAPLENGRASLAAIDACLGVPGVPQSATGQAVLLTGKNVPALLGYHYGPKPNQAIVNILQDNNLFLQLRRAGKRVGFLNAYPPRYFASIESGLRLYSAIPQAVTSAGLALQNVEDLRAGRAISADFTAQGWRDRLGLAETPVLSPHKAGQRLAALAQEFDFSFFEYWLSDYAGHGQDMAQAEYLLETFDQVLAGLLADWDFQNGLVLVTSDHGNLEDLSTRRHTMNPVPCLLIGAPLTRKNFIAHPHDLTDIAPSILSYLGM